MSQQLPNNREIIMETEEQSIAQEELPVEITEEKEPEGESEVSDAQPADETVA